MSTPHDQREALSAMIDAESDELEVRRTAARLLDDAELQATWRRYHLVGAVMRGETSHGGSPADAARTDLAAAARLRAALVHEPVWGGAVGSADDDAAAAAGANAAQAHGAAGDARRARPPVAADAGAGRVVPLPSDAHRAPARRRWYSAGIGLATAAGVAGGLWIGGLAPKTASQQVVDRRPIEATVVQSDFDAQRRARMYMLMHAQQASLSQDVQGMVKFVSYEQQ